MSEPNVGAVTAKGPEAAASRPVRVTLFEDRAEVVREATVRVPPGGGWVRVAGLTPYVDDRSVQVRVAEGPSRVAGARVARRVVEESSLGGAAIEAIEREIRAAARDVKVATHASAREQARAERSRALLASWAAGVSAAPAAKRAPMDGWRAAYDAIASEESDAIARWADAERAKTAAGDAWRRANARLAEGRATHLRREALVEIRLEPADSEGAGDAGAPGEGSRREDAGARGEGAVDGAEVRLVITYRTPGALWRPEHAVRASRDGDAAQVEILTWAAIWQRTGEAWDDVEVELSTARPAREAVAPLLADDVLASRRKSDEERQRTVVEARDQRIASADAFGAARAVAEMPGVDDGGVPLVYSPAKRTSLRSDGRPARVEIGRRAVDAAVDVVVFAELAKVAHVRARGKIPASGPLLAGPLHVTLDGATAGRSKTRFVGAGEPFEIGLGTEDAVRVWRDVESEDDVAAIVGTQKRKRTVVVWLWNLSRAARRVKVVERIPVSEIDGLDVTLVSAREWSLDRRDGFATRDVDLAANGSEKVTLVYEVRAPSKVVLPQF